MKDLFILCADLDAINLLEGLLPRVPHIENIKPIDYDIRKHPNRDNGIRTDAHNFLRPLQTQYAHVLVVLDYEGSGENVLSSTDLAQEIKDKIVANGWPHDRVAVICINPELENWIWVKSQKIAELLNWQEEIDIYDWLEINDFPRDATNHNKPTPPKEAFDTLLKQCNEPHSASLFKELAKNASYKNCTDPSFLDLLNVLHIWFPQ